MKLPFTIRDSRFTIWKKSSRAVVAGRCACARGNRKSSIINRKSERGIALIITLILLSVTLVMAIAFLAISRRERGSVSTSTDTATARLAADSALASAEAQIVANMLSTTNPYSFGLLVSTNYISAAPFQTAPPAAYANPTNVNYYDSSGNLLAGGNLEQNIANLYYLPRPPVFVVTNQQTGSNEFRFYLDLNRNGKFEDSGNVPNVENGFSGPFTNGTISEIGDPQWIGVLERPDTTHGPNNHFLSRYAFIAMPVGNSLDLNYIHNAALNPSTKTQIDPLGGDFRRNEGVGSWEINLAAFLADLNTNTYAWGGSGSYTYNPLVTPTTGNDFIDALELYRFRLNGLRTGVVATDYAYNTAVLNSVDKLFGTAGDNAFSFDQIDDYSAGSPMTGTQLPIDSDNADINYSWPGADSINHFFDLSADLFDPNKSSPTFVSRLNAAGAATSTYDRYTFYRLLAQLGTDSSPESGKMNLNYDNLDPGLNGALVANGTTSATNFVPWTAIGFFTNAADRMLRLYTTNWFQENPSNYLATYYGLIYTNQITVDQFGQITGLTNAPFFGMTNQVPAFGITNIPVYVNGQFVYSSAVNRILQLAANIYDATTNNTSVLGFDFPNVFRPFFNATTLTGTKNVYIGGFNEVTNVNEADLPMSHPYDLNNQGPVGSFGLTDLITTGPNYINIFGVPMIIGAKKGFPNFNQFAMQNMFFIVRELQITRTSTNAAVAPPISYQINQQFQCGITNQLEVELWNSYSNNYTRSTDIYVTNFLTMTLTNDERFIGTTNMTISASTNLTSWPGYDPNSFVSSIQLPLNTNVTFLPGAIYLFNSGTFPGGTSPSYFFNGATPNFTTNLSTPFETGVGALPAAYTPSYPQPHWWLIVTNNIQVAMVDDLTKRLIDYVQLSGPNSTRDITGEITNADFYTNLARATSFTPANLPAGIYNEIYDFSDDTPLDTTLWGSTSPQQAQYQVDGLRNFYHNYLGSPQNKQAFGATNLAFGVTMNPIIVVRTTKWQANDPLVHYIASDLNDTANDTNVATSISPLLIGITAPNERYQPWGVTSQMSQKVSPDSSRYNTALKDPLATNSDAWDFPTNKFPTVGWLGRVHRGTPWQTVYLKASNILDESNGTNAWINWTGNMNVNDAANASPVQDRLLFDLFTTAPNDNATRGQLSVNVDANTGDPASGLAAWSAVFSGIVEPTNLVGGYTIIQPAGANGLNSTLGQLVANINYTRAHISNPDGITNAFEHVGDILAATNLTEANQWVLQNNADTINGINDEMYEWLPQQTMSLLRASSAPRYVIYSYGQTLKPAPNGIVTDGGTFFGMVTNYQVVSEIATRAVVRVEDAKTTHPHVVVESFNVLPPD